MPNIKAFKSILIYTLLPKLPLILNLLFLPILSPYLTLTDYGIQVTIFDPMANPAEVKHEYRLDTTTILPAEKFDAVVLGVAHKAFLEMNLSSLQNGNSILYDVKGVLDDGVDGRL